ncbi:MAG TPA: ATP-grasp domain-containing protein [bacterium]|nr:ATP-grasp domain-containing protein [bacterium]
MKIAIVYNEITAESAGNGCFEAEADVLDERDAVERALKELGHEVCCVSVGCDTRTIIDTLQTWRPDLVFNLAESVLGNSQLEMTIPAILELMAIPYTGSNPAAIAVSLDKGISKKLLAFHAIRTPDFAVVRSIDDVPSLSLEYPLFVKPLWEDGSIGITENCVVRDADCLMQTACAMLERFRGLLVEEYVEGREFNVSIVGNGALEVLPVSEIDYSGMPEGMTRILSYNAKWIKGSAEYAHTKPVCPARISDELRRTLVAAAENAYASLGLSGYGRIDFRVDRHDNVFVIDVNPNPCIAPDAGLAVAARAAGISFAGLVKKIVTYAAEQNGCSAFHNEQVARV